jgi:hypothetical protein
MALEVEIVQHKTCLECIVSGDYELQETIDISPPVLMACKNAGLYKLLVDFRLLEGPCSLSRKYCIPIRSTNK